MVSMNYSYLPLVGQAFESVKNRDVFTLILSVVDDIEDLEATSDISMDTLMVVQAFTRDEMKKLLSGEIKDAPEKLSNPSRPFVYYDIDYIRVVRVRGVIGEEWRRNISGDGARSFLALRRKSNLDTPVRILHLRKVKNDDLSLRRLNKDYANERRQSSNS